MGIGNTDDLENVEQIVPKEMTTGAVIAELAKEQTVTVSKKEFEELTFHSIKLKEILNDLKNCIV